MFKNLTKQKASVIPDKQTLNLCVKERPANYYPRLICGLLIIAIAAVAFGKFFVYDRFVSQWDAWRLTDDAQQRYEQIAAANIDFDDVKEQHDRYFANDPLAGEVVDCMEVLSLVEAKLMKTSKVTSFALKNTTLTVTLKGSDLDTVSGLYQSLYESELVESVEVYTAANPTDEAETSVSMTIKLRTDFSDNSEEGGAGQ